MVVSGERRNGWLKRRWMDNIKDDLTENGLSGEEAQN